MSDFINLKDDLISRSKLLMHLNDYALQEAPFIEGQSKEAYNAIQNCMKAAEDAPAVEAKPVVFGKWLPIGMRAVGPYPDHYCDKCGCHGYDDYKFCPGCGAKMKEKE